MTAWPQLDWTVPARDTHAWAQERVEAAAGVIRRFEVALEDAAQAGEIDLGAVKGELARWDTAVLAVYAYTAMGEERPVPHDVPRLAAHLREAWIEIGGLRGRILERLGGPKAARVLEREGASPASRSLFRPRAATQTAPSSLARFTGESHGDTAPPVAAAVTAEEVRLRQAAEQKPIPATRSLGALLALLPLDWTLAVLLNLGLPTDSGEEMTAGTRAAAQRGVIFDRLRDEAFLARVVGSLPKTGRELLSKVLKANGTLPYGRVVERYGRDEADGYHWSKRPPSGALASLRRAGLLFVGLHQGIAVVAVPADLAPRLDSLLAEQSLG